MTTINLGPVTLDTDAAPTFDWEAIGAAFTRASGPEQTDFLIGMTQEYRRAGGIQPYQAHGLTSAFENEAPSYAFKVADVLEGIAASIKGVGV